MRNALTILALAATAAGAGAQAAGTTQAPKKADSAAMKQKMGEMKHEMKGEMKHDMKGEMKHDMGAMKEQKGEMKHDMAGMQGGMKEEKSGWKELDAFHTVMGAAWHPVMAGDFKPARAKAQELAAAHTAWLKSKGPAACENEATRTGLRALAADIRSYNDAVKREASDDAVRVTLKRVHDSFETFAEPCMMAAMKHETKKP